MQTNGQINGQTNMTELMIALLNFATAPRNDDGIVNGRINVID
jgi:hypothetical protein